MVVGMRGWLTNGIGGPPALTLEAPVPVKVTDCGVFGALSVIVIAPLRVPVAVGVNVTLIVQLVFAARLAGQLFVSPKSPLGAIAEIARVAFPVLVNVTGCATLVVFTAWPGKMSELEASVTAA